MNFRSELLKLEHFDIGSLIPDVMHDILEGLTVLPVHMWYLCNCVRHASEGDDIGIAPCDIWRGVFFITLPEFTDRTYWTGLYRRDW